MWYYMRMEMFASSLFITKSAAQTKRLARILIKKILSGRFPEKAIVIGLKGNLGSGKTAFVQGFAAGFGIKENVLSPSFVLMKIYRLAGQSYFKNLIHIDAYRIEKSQEILDLGFKKLAARKENIILVEWADRIRRVLPRNTLWLKFQVVGRNERKIIVNSKVEN